MKILYTDLICPSGHVFYNNVQIALLSRKYSVDFVFQKGYANKLKIPDGSNIMEYVCFSNKNNVRINALLYRLYMIKYQKYIAKVAEEGRYDYIFVSSFETFSFCINIPYKCKVIAVCHNNIDYIQKSYLKRYLFVNASRKVNFLVLNKTSSEYFEIIGAKYFRVSHGTILFETNKNHGKFIFMPINDCLDMKTLKYLISIPFLEYLRNLNVKLYIKEKFVEVNHPNIVKLPNYIDQCNFESFINSAMAVILPYDLDKYKYRSSGLFYESVGRNKVIIAPCHPNFSDDVCTGDLGILLYKNSDDIPKLLSSIINNGINVSYKGLFERMNLDIIEMIN